MATRLGFRPGIYRLPFRESRRETPTSRTFRFGLEGTEFRYRPNQFIALGLPGVNDPWGPFRRFSLSSSPTETEAIAITTKMTGSPYKERLASLERGKEVEVRGPMGGFILEETRPAAMIAGGVGISPFRGMIRYAFDRGLATPIVLLYSARVPEEFAFAAELDAVARKGDALRMHYTVTRPEESTVAWTGRTGRIDASLIREAEAGLRNPLYYACGTPALVQGVVTLLLRELQVPADDIRIERFMGY